MTTSRESERFDRQAAPEAPARILFIGRHDWANFAHRIARALRSVGVDARVWVQRSHPYGYAEDAWQPGELAQYLQEGCDWLLSTGDGAYDIFREVAGLGQHENLGTLHVGSAFRGDPEALHAYDRELGAQVQFIGADSMRLRSELPAYPMWIAAEHWAEPDESRDGILHCPSNRCSKGTAQIIAAAELANVKLTLLECASPGDVIAAMGRAAVYVDEINAHVGGMGCAAVEAAAMGCAVVTDGRHWPTSQPWTPPFQQVRDAEDLAAVFADLRGAERDVRTGWYMHHAQRDHAYARHYCSQGYVAQQWLDILRRHGG